MSDISTTLLALLRYDKVLTIQRMETGFMVTFSDMENDDESLFFVPEQLMRSEDGLGECLQTFYEHQLMQHLHDLQA